MPNNQAPQRQLFTVDISTKTILKVLVILLVLTFLWFIRDIVLMVLVAIILSSAIDAPVDWLHRRGVPRTVSVLFIYLALVGLISIAIVLVIPPIATQARTLANQLPDLFDRFNAFLSHQSLSISNTSFIENLQKILSNIGTAATGGSSVFGTVSRFFGGIFQVALVLVLTFYLVVQENGLKRFVRSIVPARQAPYVTQLMNRIQLKIGHWFRAQLLLGVFVGVLVYIGLTIIGVEYALVLAILAGILEIIPYVGPILSAVPAVFLALPNGLGLALATVVVYILVQQSESHIIAPKLMQKAVGLNPVVVIVALLIGAKLAGFAGIILSVPVATAIAEFSRDFFGTGDDDGVVNSDSWMLQTWNKFLAKVKKERDKTLNGQK